MAGETTVLLVTDKPSLPGTVVMWAMQKFEDKAEGGKGMTVVTNILQAGGKIAAESLSINVVISLAATPGHHNTAWLTEVARVLRPGGEFWLQEPLMSRLSALQTITSLERNLILSGFLGSKSFESVEDIGLAESYQAITPVSLQVQKPNWELGSAFTLKKRTLAPKEDVTDDVIPLVKSWNWSPDVDLDELIDEDELLTEDDLRRPELPVGDDCSVEKVGKKACKNCSCGRVELEEKKVSSVLTASQINNPQSACGNCGLGDAFRCNGCPYRGQPPFKLGEKITLSSSLLVADA
ncbi:unnamed protein product [Sphagnum troendelagicum]|uniref:Anamorsin homolog n=1 Tax=Sphagnum troendelagicum TaxID=128251 RepID=A0ABP0TQ45_9BRYO